MKETLTIKQSIKTIFYASLYDSDTSNNTTIGVMLDHDNHRLEFEIDPRGINLDSFVDFFYDNKYLRPHVSWALDEYKRKESITVEDVRIDEVTRIVTLFTYKTEHQWAIPLNKKPLLQLKLSEHSNGTIIDRIDDCFIGDIMDVLCYLGFDPLDCTVLSNRKGLYNDINPEDIKVNKLKSVCGSGSVDIVEEEEEE